MPTLMRRWPISAPRPGPLSGRPCAPGSSPGGRQRQAASIGARRWRTCSPAGSPGRCTRAPPPPGHPGVAAYPDLSSCPEPRTWRGGGTRAAGGRGRRPGLRAQESGGTRDLRRVRRGRRAGRALQDDLRRRARAAGVRLIGPNCMGLLNGGPDRRSTRPSASPSPAGPTGVRDLSGGLGLAALTLPPALRSASAALCRSAKLPTYTQRAAAVPGRRPRHQPRAGLPAVVPDPRCFAGSRARLPAQAHRGGEGRPNSRLPPAGVLAHRGAGRWPGGGRGAVPPGGGDPGRHAAGHVRRRRRISAQPVPSGRRVAALTTVQGRAPGRRRLRRSRAAGARIVRRHPGGAACRPPPRPAVGNPVDIVASASASSTGGRGAARRGRGGLRDHRGLHPPFLTRAEDFAARLRLRRPACPPSPSSPSS